MTFAVRPAKEKATRLRLRLRGAVQGVGFRPFAFGLAARFGLSGFVRNDAQGVLIEVEGAATAKFVAALREELPPLARLSPSRSKRFRSVAERSF